MQSAKELFTHELTDMLDAEQKLVEALGQLADDHAEEPQLQKAFQSHQAQTEKQVERIRQVFEELDEEPEETECKGMRGLIEERDSFKQEEDPADDILAVFDIGAAIKVESYEISAYNSLIELAQQLELNKAVKLLNQSLKEEEQTRTKLEGLSRKMKPDNLGLEEEQEGGETEMEAEEERPARRSASSQKKGRSRRVA
jgi:ferritin-like metal-binding protein YciE